MPQFNPQIPVKVTWKKFPLASLQPLLQLAQEQPDLLYDLGITRVRIPCQDICLDTIGAPMTGSTDPESEHHKEQTVVIGGDGDAVNTHAKSQTLPSHLRMQAAASEYCDSHMPHQNTTVAVREPLEQIQLQGQSLKRPVRVSPARKHAFVKKSRSHGNMSLLRQETLGNPHPSTVYERVSMEGEVEMKIVFISNNDVTWITVDSPDLSKKKVGLVQESPECFRDTNKSDREPCPADHSVTPKDVQLVSFNQSSEPRSQSPSTHFDFTVAGAPCDSSVQQSSFDLCKGTQHPSAQYSPPTLLSQRDLSSDDATGTVMLSSLYVGRNTLSASVGHIQDPSPEGTSTKPPLVRPVVPVEECQETLHVPKSPPSVRQCMQPDNHPSEAIRSAGTTSMIAEEILTGVPASVGSRVLVPCSNGYGTKSPLIGSFHSVCNSEPQPVLEVGVRPYHINDILQVSSSTLSRVELGKAYDAQCQPHSTQNMVYSLFPGYGSDSDWSQQVYSSFTSPVHPVSTPGSAPDSYSCDTGPDSIGTLQYGNHEYPVSTHMNSRTDMECSSSAPSSWGLSGYQTTSSSFHLSPKDRQFLLLDGGSNPAADQHLCGESFFMGGGLIPVTTGPDIQSQALSYYSKCHSNQNSLYSALSSSGSQLGLSPDLGLPEDSVHQRQPS